MHSSAVDVHTDTRIVTRDSSRQLFYKRTSPHALHSLAPVVELTEDDREALDTIRGALALLQQVLGSATGAPGSEPGPLAPASLTQLRDAARELQPLVPELLPGVVATAELFVRALLRRVLLRLADELGPGERGVVQGVAAGMVAAMPLATQVEVLINTMTAVRPR